MNTSLKIMEGSELKDHFKKGREIYISGKNLGYENILSEITPEKLKEMIDSFKKMPIHTNVKVWKNCITSTRNFKVEKEHTPSELDNFMNDIVIYSVLDLLLFNKKIPLIAS